MKFNRELMKGHLKTIVLSALSDGPCHAYGLKKRIQEKSLDVFSIPEGTIYPTLHKLEKDGLIESQEVESQSGREIRNYSITSKGIKTLEDNRREWSFFSRAMKLMLESEL
ncbi:MAG: helix-turn-helix transcriptional regulator [Candidatus Omnitrophica bacterium]|nr:helix-turn-helix transcriptional regulator [Candidatus Omnitrophota bacterium]